MTNSGFGTSHHSDGDIAIAEIAHADAAAAGRLSALVRGWIGCVADIDRQRVSDVALATYEALANCVDHAYRTHTGPRMMAVDASYNPRSQSLRIGVTDRGRWATARAPGTTRGRGLTLMRALADSVTIDGTATGTTVWLRFHGCRPRSAFC